MSVLMDICQSDYKHTPMQSFDDKKFYAMLESKAIICDECMVDWIERSSYKISSNLMRRINKINIEDLIIDERLQFKRSDNLTTRFSIKLPKYMEHIMCSSVDVTLEFDPYDMYEEAFDPIVPDEDDKDDKEKHHKIIKKYTDYIVGKPNKLHPEKIIVISHNNKTDEWFEYTNEEWLIELDRRKHEEKEEDDEDSDVIPSDDDKDAVEEKIEIRGNYGDLYDPNPELTTLRHLAVAEMKFYGPKFKSTSTSNESKSSCSCCCGHGSNHSSSEKSESINQIPIYELSLDILGGKFADTEEILYKRIKNYLKAMINNCFNQIPDMIVQALMNNYDRKSHQSKKSTDDDYKCDKCGSVSPSGMYYKYENGIYCLNCMYNIVVQLAIQNNLSEAVGIAWDENDDHDETYLIVGTDEWKKLVISKYILAMKKYANYSPVVPI